MFGFFFKKIPIIYKYVEFFTEISALLNDTNHRGKEP